MGVGGYRTVWQKNALKLRKGILNNEPLMMKTFSDDAKKILMETMSWDGGKVKRCGPNINSALAFQLSAFVETCASDSFLPSANQLNFTERCLPFPFSSAEGYFQVKPQPFVW